MAIDPETQNWIDEMKKHGAIDDDLRPFLARVEMSEPLRNALKGSVSATADYKRKMDLLAKQEKDAQELVAANVALQQELVRWQEKEVKPTLDRANAIMNEQAALKAKISERAKQLQDKYGIEDADVSDLLESSAQVTKQVAKAAKAEGAEVTDDGRFVRADDFNKVSRAMPRLASRLEKLGRKFDRLFEGTEKEFDPDLVLDLAEKENTTLDAAFSKLYDVPVREKELANQAKEKEFADRLAKEKAQWMAQQGTQGPSSVRADERGAYLTDVLNRHKGKEGEGKSAEPPNPIERIRQAAHPVAPEEAVSRYVSNFRTAKYKDKGIGVEPGA